MDLLQALRRLSDLDDEWEEKARRFQEVRSRLSNDSPLQEKRAVQRARQEELAGLRRRLQDLELELGGLQQRSSQLEKELYSGSVLAPRELENMRRESQALKRRVDQLEDQVLELMVRIEELTPLVEQGAAELAQFESAWEQEMASGRREYGELRAHLEALKADRDALRQQIPSRELALYDELRRSKGGRPLAPMIEGVCQVCRVTVPTHKVAVAQGGADTVATCEGCGRILYQA